MQIGIKTPFQTVLGFSELLKFRYSKLTEEKLLKYIDIIFVASNNLYQLLENLLNWARTQTERIKFEKQKIIVNDIIRDNVRLLTESIEKKQIKVDVECDDMCEVLADKDMINAVIRNLLTNAIKFSHKGGRIDVKCEKRNGSIKVSVNDSGVGMTLKDTKKLFRIDENFSKTGTNGEHGTRLGLILCKEFIERHGGQIWVESKPNKGSKFIFTIPVSN